jgi:hypothetical protein
MSLMKIGEVKAILHLKAHWNFHPKFPRLVSCFGAIRYNRTANNAVENFFSFTKIGAGKALLFLLL